MPPVGAVDVDPPVVRVAQVHRSGRLAKHHGRGLEQLRPGTGVVVGIRRPLGERDVAGRVHKAAEVGIRHRELVHPESPDAAAMRGSFLGVVRVRSHQVRAAGDPDHPLGRRLALRRRSLGCRVCRHHWSMSTNIPLEARVARAATAPRRSCGSAKFPRRQRESDRA